MLGLFYYYLYKIIYTHLYTFDINIYLNTESFCVLVLECNLSVSGLMFTIFFIVKCTQVWLQRWWSGVSSLQSAVSWRFWRRRDGLRYWHHYQVFPHDGRRSEGFFLFFYPCSVKTDFAVWALRESNALNMQVSF